MKDEPSRQPKDRTIVKEPNLLIVEGTLIADVDDKDRRVLILSPTPITQHFIVTLNRTQARRVGAAIYDWGREE